MGYSEDIMKSLTFALRDLEGLKNELKKLNGNMETFERLAVALEKANALKEAELYGIINNKTNEKHL
jgi:hypothetical protein